MLFTLLSLKKSSLRFVSLTFSSTKNIPAGRIQLLWHATDMLGHAQFHSNKSQYYGASRGTIQSQARGTLVSVQLSKNRGGFLWDPDTLYRSDWSVPLLFILYTFLEDAKGFDLLCDRLEKNRVKCYYLFMFVFGGQVWTKEQCVKLFKILNPVKVFLSSDGSNRYEAVYHTRNLVRLFSCLSSF